MNLRDKVVVITGGSRGFGLELARLFEIEGAKVAVGDKVCDVPHTSPNIYSFSCDVTSEQEVLLFTKSVLNKFGRVDLWINNAGVWIPHTNVENISVNDARRIFEVNMIGTFICTKQILPIFKAKGGSLINIISTSALGPRPTTAIYSASKYAVNGFTQAIREELKGSGVKVYSIFPGAMKTDIFNDGIPEDFETYMDAKEVAQEVIENLKKENPEEELVIRRN